MSRSTRTATWVKHTCVIIIGKQVVIIYFDFAKAFDSVSHPILVHKLRAYGFCGRLLYILSDFLADHTQRVVLPNGVSTFCPVVSGVPQGSVLGPMLFLIYINDIVDLFHNVNVKLYADDVKIYLDITSHLDVLSVQDCIDNIVTWRGLTHGSFS